MKLYSSVVVLKTKYVILLTIKSTVIYCFTTLMAVIKGPLSTGEEEHGLDTTDEIWGTDALQRPFSARCGGA